MKVQDVCPRCEIELPADAPEGLCPECLLRQSVAAAGVVLVSTADAAPWARGFVPPAPADLAYLFPQLEIHELVGKGGMGAVYRARQPGLDRLVALKILPPEVARAPAFAERFSREARSLARFNHPHIVTIYDFGETGGLYYILMEYVAGQNLRQLLEAGTLSQEQILRLVAQVCDALQYAHDAGVVHRDIKPENILLDARGQVKIADFGLAKLVGLPPAHGGLTDSRAVMGTLYYMAPEQLMRNLEVDHRADLYSLGVVLYEMLTGELPVGRFAPPAQRAAVDARLDAVVLRALESKPEHRYQDAADVKRDVEAILAGRSMPAVARTDRPCVRFSIRNVSWLGAYVEGEMYRDDTTLVLDFSVVGGMGTVTAREVLIPLADIVMISLHRGDRPNLPRWLNALIPTTPELVLKVKNPAVVANLPAGKQGWGRLRIHRGDLDAAQQLVASILRAPLPPRAALDRARLGPVLAEANAEAARVRKQLRGPAWALLLTAAAALFCTIGPVFVAAVRIDRAQDVMTNRVILAVGTVLALLFIPPLIVGARQMLRRRSYVLCVATALVALLPWSPAWLVGLPAGIWTLRVLGRRDVILAFVGERDGSAAGRPRDPDPPRRAPGKIRRWLRSFASCFVTLPGSKEMASRQR
jgi:predicted Ser/Thr protein kinase